MTARGRVIIAALLAAAVASAAASAADAAAEAGPARRGGADGAAGAGGVRGAGGADAKVAAITNVRIVPVVGAEVASGTIVIEGGLIAGIGAGVAVPAGAEVVDGTGLRAYPGMIDSYSQLGLVEISGVAATVDNRETGRINPQVRALEAVRYDSMHIPIARSNGVTAAVVAPSGGVISGVSCLLRLDGWTNREMAVKPMAAMHIELPGLGGGRGGFAAGRMGAGTARVDGPGILAELKALFAAARAYEKRRDAAAKDARLPLPEFDETSEALLPLLKGEMPAMISVHGERDIRAAIAFVRDEGLGAVFYGVEQGFKAAGELAAAGIPVVLGSLYDLPPVWEDGYDAVFRNAGVMAKAGVKVAFSSSSSSLAKDLPYHAAKAAAFGLDRAEALRAVTINPAEIFGVADRMGSLEKGKAANIVLADNDILELRTKIVRVWIDGRECDLSNRYTELLEKFKKKGSNL
ncbi:MAG TPA: amidohydrolase family protein [Candidatus Aminicenantes bacterium]|nr:amidohydrolase family protein [Candidatus Aminicenantes bacterium]